MKALNFRAVLLCLIMSVTVSTFAQAPEKFNYQTTIRDASGQILADSTIDFRVGILNGTETGPVDYEEIHNVTTNAVGVASFKIGDGLPSIGAFSSIGWGSNNYFLKIEIDPDGNGFQILGTSLLVSVPYALHANIADSISTENDPQFNQSPASTITNTDIIAWDDSANNIRNLNASNYNTININHGDIVKISGIIDLGGNTYSGFQLKDSLQIIGGGFKNGAISLSKRARIVGGNYDNITFSGNSEHLFNHCYFQNSMAFPNSVTITNSILENVNYTSTYAPRIIENSTLNNVSALNIPHITNCNILNSTIGSSISNVNYSGNVINTSTFILSAPVVFSNNSCVSTKIEITGSGQRTISNNRFTGIKSGETEIIQVNASSGQRIVICNNTMDVASSSPQSIRVTGTASAITSALQISNNVFYRGIKAIDHSMGIKSNISWNTLLLTSIGVTQNTSINIRVESNY